MTPPHLKLATWLSPAFPVGGFAYSHGLEWAQESGDVRNAATLESWLRDLLRFGAPANDAVLFAMAHRAVAETGEPEEAKSAVAALAHVAELGLALASSAERRLETVAQGNAFVAAASAAWPCAALERLRAAWAGDVVYPVAVAVLAQGQGVPLPMALEAFLAAVLANLVSAAVRLGVVGQTDGQRLAAALLPEVAALAASRLQATEEDLGGAAFRSDLAAIRHETQYTRLFRS